LLVIGGLLSTSALTKTLESKRVAASKSAAARTAICKADCLPGNLHTTGLDIGMHGFYRSYSTWDPHLVSPEGKKEYAACVAACAGPLPTIYIQRPLFAMNIKWFGMTQETCFACHSRTGENHLLPSTGVGQIEHH
jgi:hypothetical protein